MVRAVRAGGGDLATGIAGVGLGIDRDQQRVLVVDRGDPAVDGGTPERHTVIKVQRYPRNRNG